MDAYALGVAAGRANQGILTNPYKDEGDMIAFRKWVDGWVEGIRLWHSDRLAEYAEPTHG